MPSESPRGSLPFEPGKNKKKRASKAQPASTAEKKPSKRKLSQASHEDASLQGIPDVVSKRMGRRMAVFCGIPSALGMSSLFIFYWLFSHEIIQLPPYIALAVSFSFLGMGLLGLSYGIFSASWDESQAGSLLGIAEFKTNFQRTTSAWRESRNKAKAD